jgi:predicted dehydrogenase
MFLSSKPHRAFGTVLLSAWLLGCSSGEQPASTRREYRLMTLDPGHFHAALVQKSMYPQVDTLVHVYAPAGPDLDEHLKRVEGYNTRPENATHWRAEVYRGPDFLAKMLAEKPGNVLVLAGNNRHKTDYVQQAVAAKLHVLADKPMCIDTAGFARLRAAFATAQANGVLLYDIMTERSEITTMLQKELSQLPTVFGELQKGSPDNPAVTKESVHHFYKQVSGKPLKRPAWFMDVAQQGEGIVDVTTHLVDLVQWACFPEQTIDYQKDVEVLNARRWPTALPLGQFARITQLPSFPAYLQKDVVGDSVLNIYCNGEISYRLRGVHAKVSVVWHYEAPAGAGDTHASVMRGTLASLEIRQGPAEQYVPELYLKPAQNSAAYETALAQAMAQVQAKFPGVELKKRAGEWLVVIPAQYRTGHEAHFAEVMQRFLGYLQAGQLPAWEVPNMLAKYYTTTRAWQMAR